MNAIQKIFAFALFLVISSFSIKASNDFKVYSEIQRVTVAFSGFNCESDCPYEAFSVDSSLKTKYFGGEFAKRKGFFKGRISETTWDSIQARFQKFISNGIDSVDYQQSDSPEVEFYITTNDKKYSFRKDTGKMGGDDVNTLNWFIAITLRMKSLRKTESLLFETTIQSDTNPFEN